MGISLLILRCSLLLWSNLSFCYWELLFSFSLKCFYFIFIFLRLMAHPADHRMCGPGVLRCVLVLLILVLIGCIVGRPIFWHFGDNSHAQASCLSCDCDCDSDNIFSAPLGELNTLLAFWLFTLKFCRNLVGLLCEWNIYLEVVML